MAGEYMLTRQELLELDGMSDVQRVLHARDMALRLLDVADAVRLSESTTYSSPEEIVTAVRELVASGKALAKDYEREHAELTAIDALVACNHSEFGYPVDIVGPGVVERVRDLRELSAVNSSACDSAMQRLEESVTLVSELSEQLRRAEAERDEAWKIAAVAVTDAEETTEENDEVHSRFIDCTHELDTLRAKLSAIADVVPGEGDLVERVTNALIIKDTGGKPLEKLGPLLERIAVVETERDRLREAVGQGTSEETQLLEAIDDLLTPIIGTWGTPYAAVVRLCDQLRGAEAERDEARRRTAEAEQKLDAARDLICSAAPLAWANTPLSEQTIEHAYEWEKAASEWVRSKGAAQKAQHDAKDVPDPAVQ